MSVCEYYTVSVVCVRMNNVRRAGVIVNVDVKTDKKREKYGISEKYEGLCSWVGQ